MRWIFLLMVSALVMPKEVKALGVGQCHMGNWQGWPEVTWTYPSGEVNWNVIEPQKGKYDWSSVDREVDSSKRLGDKIWLHIGANGCGDDTVPGWVKEAGADVYDLGTPSPWDPVYRKYLSEALLSMKQRYEVDRWSQDRLSGGEQAVEAILISVGNCGEMVLRDNNEGSLKDGYWYPSMARYQSEKQGRVVTVEELKQTAPGKEYDWFHKYYVDEVKSIVDMYALTFRKLPVVLKVGSGLSPSSQVAMDVLNYANETYGAHVWMKFAGWGLPEVAAVKDGNNSSFYKLYNLFYPFRNKTIQAFEVGLPEQFGYGNSCGTLSTGSVRQCAWGSGADARKHNNLAVENATSGSWAMAQSICLYSEFFDPAKKDKFPLDWSVLNANINKNIARAIAAGIYPHKQLPEVGTKMRCGQAGQGCCDSGNKCESGLSCKGGRMCVAGKKGMGLGDLAEWKKEYLGGEGLMADFNGDGVVDMVDLRVWKVEYLQ